MMQPVDNITELCEEVHIMFGDEQHSQYQERQDIMQFTHTITGLKNTKQRLWSIMHGDRATKYLFTTHEEISFHILFSRLSKGQI